MRDIHIRLDGEDIEMLIDALDEYVEQAQALDLERWYQLRDILHEGIGVYE